MNVARYIENISKNPKNHKKCVVCGRNALRVNSHSIPRFSLNTIYSADDDQPIRSIRELNTFPFRISFDNLGINNAGTFHMICRQCENSTLINAYEVESYKNFDLNDRNVSQSVMIKILLHNLYYLIRRLWSANNTIKFLHMATKQDNHDSLLSHAEVEKMIVSKLNSSISHYKNLLNSLLNQENYKNNHRVVYYRKIWGVSPLNAHTYVHKATINGETIKNLYIAIFNKGEYTIEMIITKMGQSEEIISEYMDSLSFHKKSKFLLELISVSPTSIFTDSLFMEELLKQDKLKKNFMCSKAGYALTPVVINEVDTNLPAYTNRKYDRISEVLGMEEIRLIDRLDLDKVKAKIKKDPAGISLQVLADEYNVSRQRMDQAFQEIGFDYKDYKDKAFDQVFIPKVRDEVEALIKERKGRISNDNIVIETGFSHVVLLKAYTRKELQELKKKYRKTEGK